MFLYIDNEEKICYIMAPKCGSHTISKMLNTNLHTNYSKLHLQNDAYKKIIIIRQDLVDRFLSGFYEDLFNNTCYNNMNVTFNDYLLFLFKCYNQKIANVNNLQVFTGTDIPIWWGNCSGVYKNITDNNGKFCSHIMSQKYAIGNICKIISKNVEIVDLNELHKILPNVKKCHMREKITFTDFDVTNIPLSVIKKQNLIMSKDNLNETQKNIILEIYKEDSKFFKKLQNRFTML